MIAKHKLVNFLYLIGFPFYGIGNYVTFTNTFSVGVIFSGHRGGKARFSANRCGSTSRY